jgi:hypothetical protein
MGQMMRVYRVVADNEQYSFLTPCVDSDWTQFRALGGGSLRSTWKPVNMSVVKTDQRGRALRDGDFASILPHCPAIRIGKWERLRPYLEGDVEALPLAGEASDYLCLNVTRLASEALDVTLSEIRYMRAPLEGILDIRKFVFRPDSLASLTLFRLEIAPMLLLMASDKMAHLLRVQKLKGLTINEVWRGSA